MISSKLSAAKRPDQEKEAAKQARQESAERLRHLAAAVTFEGIVITEDDTIVDCNEQFARMIQAGTPRQVDGRPVLDFVASEDHDLVRRNSGNGDDNKPYEYQARRLDGSTFHVEAHGKSVPYDGRCLRVTAMRDITDRKRFHEEARQAQKMEAIGRLAGGIAHDFNNLLTIILGHCSILGHGLEADARLQRQVSEIRQAAEQAGLMTRRLLAFGRKQPAMPESLDLNEVIQGMERMLRRLIRADIDLVVNLRRGIGRVRADPGQLEQVVLNLAINAVDAMPGGGTLTLETSLFDLDDTGLHWQLDGGLGAQVLLVVRDNGVGMAPETLDRLFEPFFTTKKKGKGTGLGLSTVYAIVKQCGGSILVDSRPGRGTEFRLFFPQILESEETAAPEPEVANLEGGSERILVVEDEDGVRNLAREFLEFHGYQVVTAEDGRRGLETFERSEQKIDLILSDVVMPGMSGPEMAERIALSCPGVRVLFMSGYDDGILEREEWASGCGIVPKPFNMSQLISKVREALDEPAPRPSRELTSSPSLSPRERKWEKSKKS